MLNWLRNIAVVLLGWRPKEKFLLLEIKPQKTSGLLLGVGREKNITIEKNWDDFYLDKNVKSRAAKLFKKKLIVSADPSLAATVSFPVELRRSPESFSSPIEAVELENLLLQSIGKAFNQHRLEAARKLGLDELDTVLVGSEADNFKVDGHLIVNPLAFRGKSVGAVLKLTFAARPVFDKLKNFFGAREGFFFTNSARAGIFLLSKVEAPPLSLVVLNGEPPPCFTLEKAAWGHILYEKKLNWRPAMLLAAVSSELGVSPQAAMELYRRYLDRNLSENFGRVLGKIMKPHMETLAREAGKLNARGKIFLCTPLPLPFIPSVNYGRLILDGLPLPEAFAKFGFKLETAAARSMPGDEVFMKLAPFFEFYYDKSNSDINHRLRRRLHWLS